MTIKPLLKGSLTALFGLGVSISALADAPISLLTQIQGTVLVNQGKEFATARPGTQLHAGDRVLVMDGASVAVVYRDECVLNVSGNSLLTVRDATECSLKTAQIKAVGPQYAQLGALPLATTTMANPIAAVSPLALGAGAAGLIVGGTRATIARRQPVSPPGPPPGVPPGPPDFVFNWTGSGTATLTAAGPGASPGTGTFNWTGSGTATLTAPR